MKTNPRALSNARLLATFLIAHPDDVSFSAENQRYWTQYHKDDGRYNLSQNYHLIRPSPNEQIYCQHNSLTPYRDWINLFDDNVFLLGPFDFASFNGRRSKDRIDASLWASLSEQTSKFENTVPS